MRRRAFITLLGGAVAWPHAARAQQPDRMRRIGVLLPISEDDPEGEPRLAAFRQRLQQLGWTEGRNVTIETRWGGGDAEHMRRQAAELIALTPDAIFVTGNSAVSPLLQQTRTVPVVFALLPDPVGAGFVNSLAQPGGNATGFLLFEYAISAKWLELLKQIAPDVSRVGVMRDPSLASGTGQFGAVQSAAASVGIELVPVNVRDANEIERSITNFARGANGGLIVTASALTVVHRELIVLMAARHRLPAIYWGRQYIRSGGLISYGPAILEQYLSAAGYVDRILRGEKPADLPVQAPTKYELVINLKTAKTLGLTVPDTLLAIANEVIE